QLQKQNFGIADSRLDPPRSGPNILSASHGRVNSRQPRGRQNWTGEHKGAVRRNGPSLREICEVGVDPYFVAAALAARCLSRTAVARSRYWSASLSSACCLAGSFTSSACARSRSPL